MKTYYHKPLTIIGNIGTIQLTRLPPPSQALEISQSKGEYLVLDGDLVPLLLKNGWAFFSPVGAAEKGGKPLTEDARIIYDASYPRKAKGKNISSLTEKAKIVMKYNGPKTIALWALEMDKASVCPLDTMIMTGDVSGAFRNIPLAADSCGQFSIYLVNLNIILVNLSLPFGWTDSPAFYWLAGQAIKVIQNKRFMNLVWCDDHILLEFRIAWRLTAADHSLRRSMVLVLGTKTCN